MSKRIFCLSLLIAVAATGQKPNQAILDRCNAVLSDALADKNPDTRKQAVVALSLAGTGEPHRTQLEEMLDDKDVEVRQAAIAGMSEMKDARAIRALRKALNDETPEVSFTAARALWAFEDPAGKETLLTVLSGDAKTKSSFIKSQTRDAMRMMHSPKTIFLFAAKYGGAFAPFPGLGTGVSSMQALLSDAGVSGRATAALLLAREKDAATIEALREALSDKDWSVRAAAVHALAIGGNPKRQPDLVPLLDDKKEAVRARAAAGYLRLQMIKEGRAKPGPAPNPNVKLTEEKRKGLIPN